MRPRAQALDQAADHEDQEVRRQGLMAQPDGVDHPPRRWRGAGRSGSTACPRRRLRQDRTQQEGGDLDQPKYCQPAADLLGDAGHDRHRHQGVGGVQPDAQAQQDEARASCLAFSRPRQLFEGSASVSRDALDGLSRPTSQVFR